MTTRTPDDAPAARSIAQPASVAELADLVRGASQGGFDAGAGFSKRGLGGPCTASTALSLAAFRGIRSYLPEELVLTCDAGTPLDEIHSLLASRGQRLAFEPPDLARLFGSAGRQPTIGGTIACNLAGPGRPFLGAPRDHLLGFSAVDGRGETFRAGGQVVKNVTGYDLGKLVAGSFGTLALLTEVTLKVLPVPTAEGTLVARGLSVERAVTALLAAAASAALISAGSHEMPDGLGAAGEGTALTLLRLEGSPHGLPARLAEIRRVIAPAAFDELWTDEASRRAWRSQRDLDGFAQRPELLVWRIAVAPSRLLDLWRSIEAAGLTSMRTPARIDWAGGLVWLALERAEAGSDGGAEMVRRACAEVEAAAWLFRAPEEIRRRIAVFPPESAPLAALGSRLRDALDPRRVLSPGRMGEAARVFVERP